MSSYSQTSKNSPVVQKYGGTSLGTPKKISLIAKRIAKQKKEGWHNLAVVVSAMSGETNRLVALMNDINPQARKMHYDLVVSAGEQVSAGLLAAALEANGVKAQAFLAYQIGIKTNQSHGRARIQSINDSKIKSCWEQGLIPIIAGFQGITEDLNVTTLGRGGSDTSAVALAVALKAGFCEINTDVDGVYTSDPRYVQKASPIEILDYETALELAALGSKVLHSRCVEVAAKYSMPIVVRNSFDDDKSRSTKIMTFSNKQALEAPVVSGITVDQDVAKVTVLGVPVQNQTFSEVFDAVAKAGINVDIIVANHQEEEPNSRFGFTIERSNINECKNTLESLKSNPIYQNLEVRIQEDLAKVSAVGLGMKSHSGVAGKVFTQLTKHEIEIVMISTSEIKISCVVPESKSKKAAEVLHSCFFESE